MPVLNPAERWKRSGRYESFGAELFRFEDRRGAPMVLAMTHEEIVTMHVAQVVRSYRDLPLILYHFQTKERDEPRPRAGVLRTREFIMKDAYTFDRDAEGLDVGYRQAHRRPTTGSSTGSGLEWYRVESDVGMMGGSGAHEYMAPCAAGENDVALAPGYAANVEVAQRRRRSPSSCPPPLDAPEPVETPGMTTIAAVADHLGVAARRAAEGLPDHGRGPRPRPAHAARRPPRQRHQAAQRAAARTSARPARRSSPSAIGPPGYIGPVGAQAPILLDDGVAVGEGGYVTGANRRGPAPARRGAGARLRRSSASTRAGWRRATRSAASPIRVEPAIEVGNIFKLGTRYSEPLGATYLDEQGTRAADLDGLLRHRPGADRRRGGRAVRRRARHLVAARDRAVGRRARRAGQARHGGARRSPTACTTSCAPPGSTPLYDDRDAGPGEKFADAELLGVPLRLTVGRRTARGGRDRGAGAARPGVARRPPRGRRRGGGEPVAQPPLERAQAHLPPALGPGPLGAAAARRRWPGQPLHPWTIPNAIGYVRLALIPVFLVARPVERHGHGPAAGRPLRRHRLGGLPRRDRGARHGPVLPPRHAARPARRPPARHLRRGRVLALRAAAAVGARAPRRARARDAGARPRSACAAAST